MPNSSSIAPLIEGRQNDIVDGSVDYKGHPVHRSTSGGWRSASFIIGVEMTERFTHYGILSNLITYLSGPLSESTAAAASNVNTWSGTATLLPLLGGFVADSFLGRYRTIIVSSIIYILGLGILTLSATLTPDDSSCPKTKNVISSSCNSPPIFQVVLFFFSLYLVAFGQGGHKACIQAFGADQFDGNDPKENKAKSSFFNWWYFGVSAGIVLTLMIMVYIQDNVDWALGFGIPCIVMLASLLILLLGSTTYRYSVNRNEKNPFMRIGLVIVRSVRNWHITPSATAVAVEEEGYSCHLNSDKFRFLDKALLAPDGSTVSQKVCNVSDVEDAKALLRLIPIWITSVPYFIVFAQISTFFTKQGATMDRSLFPAGFLIPAASLQSFTVFAIILFIPLYDRVFVPIARSVSKKPSGITMLQRIGTGMVISILSMVAAALVEMKRLEIAKDHGLIDQPNVTIPMSFWWLVPQYVLSGVSDVFTIVGFQEFFYDQVPKELRSVGISLYFSVTGAGSFLSGFLVSVIDEATSRNGGESWFANNLNRAHLDYFYWLLAVISAVGFTVYLYFAKSYIYYTGSSN